ncbi:site-2 protease family protein [Floridanema evergladense]|uniref:Site-2 protease family protein n=1 Tax=Floridaenema evergladense BLCC-F167 TaxID=3153639 RepID=A0ABV4WVZ7_9CYAN
MILILLVLLGIATYFIVKRSVAGITTTPVWLLWLVMMAPPFVWTGWILAYGRNQPMPAFLLLGVFFASLILYTYLIQKGRIQPQAKANQTTNNSKTPETAKPADAEAAKVRPINKEEEAQLRDCFPWSVYYLQDLEYHPQAVICRGHLRAKSEEAYQTIRGNIEARFGDRFLVIFQNSFNDQPFFALVPNPQAHPEAKRRNANLYRPGLALTLLLITLFTTTVIGTEIAGVTVKALQSDPSLLLKGLPYSLALMTILGVHEMGHYLMAKRYKILTTLPYFIPIPFFLGTFGAFIQMRSPVPNRKALFDIGIAGPLAGFIVTLPLLFWGLANSSVVPLPERTGILQFNALIPNFSILLATLSKLALGNELTAKTAINLHPVAVAGYIGLIVTALNLMPVGQLDGGHIVHAMFGQKRAAAIGQLARLLLLFVSLIPILFQVTLIPRDFLLWAVFLFLMPVYDEPALNDVTELDNKRDLFGLLSLALLLLIILPAPQFLIQLLN